MSDSDAPGAFDRPLMSEPGDLERRLARPQREPGASDTARDALAALRGKDLGDCAACGQPVFFEQNFTGLKGRVAHVRCPATSGQLGGEMPSSAATSDTPSPTRALMRPARN